MLKENLRVRHRSSTALLMCISRSYSSFHIVNITLTLFTVTVDANVILYKHR